MNKTIKVALCISLVGIGVFVWTHVATAGKPVPAVVTFLPGGDVQAEPFTTPGPFAATVDFAKFIPYIDPNPIFPLSIEEATALLNKLASMNPITYSSFAITDSKTQPYMLKLTTTVDGVKYIVAMAEFYSNSSKTSTPTLDTYDLREGGFAVCDSRLKVLLIVDGTHGDVLGPANTKFTITK